MGCIFFAFNLKDILDCNNTFFVFFSFTALKLHNKYSHFKTSAFLIRTALGKTSFTGVKKLFGYSKVRFAVAHPFHEQGLPVLGSLNTIGEESSRSSSGCNKLQRICGPWRTNYRQVFLLYTASCGNEFHNLLNVV